MNEPGDPAAPQSLRGIRVVAAIGFLVAVAAVVVAFGVGPLYGIGATMAVPVVPLLFVLGFEAVTRSS